LLVHSRVRAGDLQSVYLNVTPLLSLRRTNSLLLEESLTQRCKSRKLLLVTCLSSGILRAESWEEIWVPNASSSGLRMKQISSLFSDVAPTTLKIGCLFSNSGSRLSQTLSQLSSLFGSKSTVFLFIFGLTKLSEQLGRS